MPVSFYFDVHVPRAITDQLRLRGVDVLTVIEDGKNTWLDEDLLEHARQIGRPFFTQDIRFWALATNWQQQNRPFAGLFYGHQQGASANMFGIWN